MAIEGLPCSKNHTQPFMEGRCYTVQVARLCSVTVSWLQKSCAVSLSSHFNKSWQWWIALFGQQLCAYVCVDGVEFHMCAPCGEWTKNTMTNRLNSVLGSVSVWRSDYESLISFSQYHKGHHNPVWLYHWAVDEWGWMMSIHWPSSVKWTTVKSLKCSVCGCGCRQWGVT